MLTAGLAETACRERRGNDEPSATGSVATTGAVPATNAGGTSADGFTGLPAGVSSPLAQSHTAVSGTAAAVPATGLPAAAAISAAVSSTKDAVVRATSAAPQVEQGLRHHLLHHPLSAGWRIRPQRYPVPLIAVAHRRRWLLGSDYDVPSPHSRDNNNDNGHDDNHHHAHDKIGDCHPHDGVHGYDTCRTQAGLHAGGQPVVQRFQRCQFGHLRTPRVEERSAGGTGVLHRRTTLPGAGMGTRDATGRVAVLHTEARVSRR